MTGPGVLVAAAVVGLLIIAGALLIAARRRPDLPVAGSDAPAADARAAARPRARADTRAAARPQDPLVAVITQSREAHGLPPVPRRDPRGSVNAPRVPVSGPAAGDGTAFGAPAWVRRLVTTTRVIPPVPPESEAAGRAGAEGQAQADERRSA